MIATPFFALLFAIIETAIVFFAGQVLETVTQDSARMIMTGQAQNAGYTQAQFKTYVCGKVSVLFDCVNGIYVDVKSYPGFSSVSTFGVSPGGRCSAANGMVRVPLRPMISTLASRASKAWAKSPG